MRDCTNIDNFYVHIYVVHYVPPSLNFACHAEKKEVGLVKSLSYRAKFLTDFDYYDLYHENRVFKDQLLYVVTWLAY